METHLNRLKSGLIPLVIMLVMTALLFLIQIGFGINSGFLNSFFQTIVRIILVLSAMYTIGFLIERKAAPDNKK